MPTLETATRNAACNAVVDLLDSGDIRFETAANNEVATCDFAATAFGDANVGVATAATISDDTSAAGGTIDHAVLRKSDTTKVMTCTVTVTGGGGDIEVTSLAIGVGDTVSVTSFTVTMPAS